MTQLRAEILVGHRYRFLNRIGIDQLTETWKAFDTRLGRPVALQLLSEHARDNTGAQAGLRATAGAGTQSDQDASGRRILDGGEDPIYGPFVVAELGSAGVTRRLPTLDPAEPIGSAGGFHMSSKRGQLVLIALVGVILVVLVAFVVAVLVLGLSDQPPAAPRPTLPPTPATSQQAQAPQQPTSRPTSPPAAQPTPQASAQPTPQAGAQPTPQAGQPTPQGGPQSKPSTGSPVDTIRQHYAFIDAKRYAEGYALMDAHLRSLNSPADYQGWFVDKISVKPISLDLASQNGTEAVVRSVVETTDRVDGQTVTKQVSEEFVLHVEDGAWRIDQVSSL